MKKSLLLLPIIGAALLLSGCGSSSTTSQTSPSQSMSAPAAGITQPQTAPVASNAITIQNFAFSPATLTVKKGTTVTWTNNDGATHQIKSATFNSSMLSKGQTFSFTFNTVGSFDYSCAIHPSMLGQIIVE